MKNLYTLYLFSLVIFFLPSCIGTKTAVSQMNGASNKRATTVSKDQTYGYEQSNPICVGSARKKGSAADQQAYLNSIAGPNGETIRYNRRGSCCGFKTKNGLIDNMGLLDIYDITYKNIKEPITLYINLYDPGKLAAPVGFSLK